jgi:hypothetical protein
MAVQQETPIGDEDLDALMAELEAETAGMVAPPPAAKKVVKPVEEDDPLAGLDEEPTTLSATPPAGASTKPAVELDPTDPRDERDELDGLDDTAHLTASPANAAHLEKSIAQANAGQVTERALIEPSIDDELAALEAEMGGTVAQATPVAKAPSAMDKLAMVAAKAKSTHPSDVPKASTAPKAAMDEKIATVAKTAAGDPDLDAELRAIAAKMPAKERDPEPNPIKNPNPRPGAALAGLDFQIDVEQFRRDISISETNLDNKMMEQAGNFAYYAEKAARAAAQAKRTKAQVEIAEGKLYAQHRSDAIAKAAVDPSFKVTEKAIESAVRMDPKYGALQNRLIEAEQIADIAKGCVEALKQNRDMIIQLGADRREDGKGAVRIMAAENHHSDLKARAAALAKRGE